MDNFFVGSLVLNSKQRIEEYRLPLFDTQCLKEDGYHVPSRYNGHWSTITNSSAIPAVFLPQRHKNMHIITVSNTPEDATKSLRLSFETLDSRYEGARQLYKLQMLLDEVSTKSFAVTVNIQATTANGKPTPGSFYLLSKDIPIYSFLCFDQKSESLRLTWSTLDIINDIRSTDLLRYVFYRFPVILNRPIFLPSQTLCSKWWNFTNSFKSSPMAHLKACNALESLLFRDPSIKNY